MNESHTAPIVLVHGIFGFAKIAIGSFKIGDYFREIPMADRVLSLTTIATPHHGSPIANAVVRKTEPWLPQVLERVHRRR